jgi:hypothetical protein
MKKEMKWYTIKCNCGHVMKNAIGIRREIRSGELTGWLCRKCSKVLTTDMIDKLNWIVKD